MTEPSTEDFVPILERIDARLDQLYYLVIGGGKESRIVETVPAWRPDECDDVCQYTEIPVPRKLRVKVGGLKVHPGVKAYVTAEAIPDLEDYEGEIPADYLTVPPVTRLRKVYRPTPKIQWTTEELRGLQRAAVAIIARDMGLSTVCKMVNPKLDWRFERREWLVDICLRLRDEELADIAKTLKFESPHNLEVIADGPKPTTGGTKKLKSKKSKAKKVAAKPKAKSVAKPKKTEEKPKPAPKAKLAEKPKAKSKSKAKPAAKPKAKSAPKKAPVKAKEVAAKSKTKEATPKKKAPAQPRKPSTK